MNRKPKTLCQIKESIDIEPNKIDLQPVLECFETVKGLEKTDGFIVGLSWIFAADERVLRNCDRLDEELLLYLHVP